MLRYKSKNYLRRCRNNLTMQNISYKKTPICGDYYLLNLTLTALTLKVKQQKFA